MRLLLRRWKDKNRDSADSQRFEGTAELHTLLKAQQHGGMRVSHVTFASDASTEWHVHDGEQILFVVEGAGFVETQSDGRVPLGQGDTVRTPAGERHRHGAEGRSMTHLAITTGLKTCWPYEPCWEDSSPSAT
jgi:quercetin dioxygenase-like cupin family protein